MIINAKYLITAESEKVSNHSILVQNGTIKEIDDFKILVKMYPSEKVENYENATLLPGLFDMHVHLGYYYSQPDVLTYDDFMIGFYAKKQAELALSLGITTVRDCCSVSGLCQQIKRAKEKGFINAPRIIHTDAGICMTGGHGHDDGVRQVDGAENIRSEIRRQLRDGADWIKLLTSHRSNIPEYMQQELDAAVDECHRRNVKAVVHAGTQPAVQMAIDAGFDTIEHGTFLTREQAKQMYKNNQAWTPTITAYTYLYEYTQARVLQVGADISNSVSAKAAKDIAFFEPAYNAYKENFKEIYDTGVTVLAGSDMVLYDAPAFPINRELSLMVDYGITPIQAIQTATINPAKVLGIENTVGKIAIGLEADLLIVEGNTAKDITTLNNVIAVYQKGEKVIL